MYVSYLTRCICKSDGCTRGHLIDAATNGELYKDIVSFMTIAIIKFVLELKIHADWLKNEITGCLKVLTDYGFKVHMIIRNNHICNTSAYHKILNQFNTPYNNLYFMYESQKIYLCFDTVHMIKGIRNNLLNANASCFQHLLLRILMTLQMWEEKKYHVNCMAPTKRTVHYRQI